MATDSTKTVACDNSAALAALAAQVVRLEEENRALLKENKCLRDSLLLLGGEGARQGPVTSATVNEERDEDSKSAESLFIIAMNALVVLTRRLIQDEVTLNEARNEHPPTMTHQESFRDTLKHVFVDSCHILCETIINSEGFWCKSALNQAHPMGWLLNNFPVKEDSSLGWFPLHWCALSNSSDLIDINVLHAHYSSDPKQRLKLNQAMSALTMSVSKPQPNAEVVGALVELDPMVVRAKSTSDESLPIMHALANNDDDATTKLLYGIYPECVKEIDTQGNRAINYACKWGSDEAVKFLLNVDSRSAHYRGEMGNTPLHDVSFNRSRHAGSEDEEEGLNIDTVMSIFHANTGAIKLPNAEGALPLHLAAKHASISVLQLMHGLYPAAVSVADNEGLCPMDYAASRPDKDEGQAGLEVVEYLLKARGGSGGGGEE